MDVVTTRSATHHGVGKRCVEFPGDGIVFSSRFDGGSMASVSRMDANSFHVTLAEDAPQSGIATGYTTWFYFEVLIDSAAETPEAPSTNNASARELTITLLNMNNQRGLYANGYTVMQCVIDESNRVTWSMDDELERELLFDNERRWMRLPTPISVEKYTNNKSGGDNNTVDDDADSRPVSVIKPKAETKMRLTFTHHVQFVKERVRFAFCYPYTYSKIQRQIASMDTKYTASQSIYYHRDVITHSLGGLPIDLLTISSHDGRLATRAASILGLYPDDSVDRAIAFDVAKKKTVLITARVHPGETPANFMLDGMLRLLLHATDPCAAALRRHFVFKIIPVLNPDGVCQGFYRTDSRGVNLNRVYENPQLSDEPAVYAVKQLLLQTTREYGHQRARDSVVYLDLHAHANHRGGFVYGNSLLQSKADVSRQVLTQSYAKLASLHSPFFDYGACSFDAENMARHDARDNNNATTSREGCSRVALYRATDLTFVYTIECNYNEGRRRLDSSTTKARVGTRPSGETPAPADRIQRHAAPLGGRLFHKFSPLEWADVGIGCLMALLDLFQLAAGRSSSSSVVAESPYRTLDGIKKSILSDLKASDVVSSKEMPAATPAKGKQQASSSKTTALIQVPRAATAGTEQRRKSASKL